MKVNRNLISKVVGLSPRIEGGTRAEIVEGYASSYEHLPPIVVFKVPDKKDYLLVDGWHRLTAAENLELEEVEADVRYGSLKEAKEFALLANLRHGLPLTRKEKRHVIAEFLKLHPERSNRWVASDLAISKNTVEGIRQILETTGQIDQLHTLVGKDGKARPRMLQPEQSEEDVGDDDEKESSDDTSPEPELPEPAPSLGPYELNKAHQADCVEALMQLPESTIDLIFVDPPYNLGKKYGTGSNDRLPDEDYYRWCMQWFMGAFRVLKPGGAFYVMHYPEVAARWKQQLDGIFSFQRWLTWVYPCNVGHSNGNWTRAQRTILYYAKGDGPAFFDGQADPQPYRNPEDIRVKHMGKRGVTPYDWWEYDLVKNVSRDKTTWPNQLPMELVKRIILSSCPSDGIVCDPCVGSGTTAAAAIEAGRPWIGFDVESKACGVVRNRVSDVRSPLDSREGAVS
jgi:DNA modification methylase